MADTKTLSQEFATFVERKRMALGWSRADLAEKIYGDPERRKYIHAIETGKREVTAKTMGLILETLGAWVEFIE